jgi:hypothetical protein
METTGKKSRRLLDERYENVRFVQRSERRQLTKLTASAPSSPALLPQTLTR